MFAATARTVSVPRWMLWTGRLLSFVVVAQLLSSAWFRATYHTYAVAEIVAGYGYPESASSPLSLRNAPWWCSSLSRKRLSSPQS